MTTKPVPKRRTEPTTDGGAAKPTCFVIAPIDDDGSDKRRETNGLIDAALTPILEGAYVIEVAHRIDESGSITRQVMERLLKAELVIAVLTHLNPNVMYELGVRHSFAKPVIVLALTGMKLPFDLSDERTIFYNADHLGVLELQEKLKRALTHAQSNNEPDNPVTRAGSGIAVLATMETEDPNAYIIERLGRMEGQIGRLINTLGARRVPTNLVRRSLHGVDTSNRVYLRGPHDAIVAFLRAIDEREAADHFEKNDAGSDNIAFTPSQQHFDAVSIMRLAHTYGLSASPADTVL